MTKTTPNLAEALKQAGAQNARKNARFDTKIIAGHFAPPLHRRLKILSAHQGRSLQKLLEEALEDLLRKYEP